jgi:predicted flavoprotein YhiN
VVFGARSGARRPRLHRLRISGASFHVRHRWLGWNAEGALRFEAPQGESNARADAVMLAPGGASRPRLGSDGAWVPLLRQQGVDVVARRPADCGFDVGWSEYFRARSPAIRSRRWR